MHALELANTVLFLSTLSLRRATKSTRQIKQTCRISIHALLAESDCITTITICIALKFLSTLSLRRATEFRKLLYPGSTNFYPRSPCGERRYWPCVHVVGRSISIHALLAESDGIGLVFMWWGVRFLSTLSLRRATSMALDQYLNEQISIHALLAESDRREGPRCQGLSEFLSTLSLRRATMATPITPTYENISIHALLAESDTWQRGSRVTYVISIHALLAESDTRRASRQHPAGISIHALLAESDILGRVEVV